MLAQQQQQLVYHLPTSNFSRQYVRMNMAILVTEFFLFNVFAFQICALLKSVVNGIGIPRGDDWTWVIHGQLDHINFNKKVLCDNCPKTKEEVLSRNLWKCIGCWWFCSASPNLCLVNLTRIFRVENAFSSRRWIFSRLQDITNNFNGLIICQLAKKIIQTLKILVGRIIHMVRRWIKRGENGHG